MRRKIRYSASAIAVVAVLALAGCGEGDETTSAGAQATQATTATTTATTAAPRTTLTTAAAGERCTNVAFSANVEDVASDIKATGLSCADAEAFVRKIGAQISSQTGPPQIQAEGFTCNRTNVRSGDHGPALGTFDCTNGTARVTLVRALVT